MQKVRQKSGTGRQVVVIPSPVTGIGTGHQFYLAQKQRPKVIPLTVQPKQRGRFSKVVVFAGICQLAGPALIMKELDFLLRHFFRSLPGQDFFQAVCQKKLIACHGYLLSLPTFGVNRLKEEAECSERGMHSASWGVTYSTGCACRKDRAWLWNASCSFLTPADSIFVSSLATSASGSSVKPSCRSL